MSGILRKTNPKVIEVKNLDFLVFGYACKIFRDDEKAKEIDQGKHLIPWMGDSSQKIDRYDVRATLYDLAPYESPAGGFGNRLSYLTAEEQRAEQLCEVERYRSLYNNDEDESVYQAEFRHIEFKRLENLNGVDPTSFNQVQFNYDTPLDETSNGGDSKSDEVDQAYVPPKNLIIPPTLELPNTMKEHAIVERTAKFIAAENMQMEIYIKAKQSNNAQFEFLMQNHRLNPYYKFVLEQFKAGTYPIEEITVENAPPDSESNDAQDNFDVKSSYSIRLPVPQIKYVPSANCAYTQLISKIKGVPLPAEKTPTVATTPTSDKDFTPVLLQYNNTLFLDNENKVAETSDKKPISPVIVNENSNSNVEVKMFSNALMLAQSYASDTEDEGENSGEENKPVLDFPIPPNYLLNIIDKTAGYVLKNGRQFEETLLSKQDERFFFLYPDHEYYSYYMYKMTGVPKNYAKVTNRKQSINQSNNQGSSNCQVAGAVSGCAEENGSKTKIITPVSFSIKTKDETAIPFIKAALPQEPSDDENDSQPDNNDPEQTPPSNSPDPSRSVPENVKKAIELVESQLLARNVQLSSSNSNTVNTNNAVCTPITKWPVTTPEKQSANRPSTVKPDTKTQQLKDQKRAEEKVKDKLAQMAREKLGLISKEKQLQLERKKRAMLFLNNIQVTSLSTATNAKTGSTNGQDTKSDSDNCSVHSIPITSYGAKSDSEESIAERDIELIITPKRRSRSVTRDKRSRTDTPSKSRSNSRSQKYKKKSSKRSKKKSKNKSVARSRSRSHSHSHSRSGQGNRDRDQTRSLSRCRSPSRSRSKHSSSKRTHSRPRDSVSSRNRSRSRSPARKRSKF